MWWFTMIHVCGAWILPVIAYLPQIMDKFYIKHGIEFLNIRRVLIQISTYHDIIPLYIIVCHCI